MRALRSWPGLLGTLTLAGLPAAAGAQPVGSEFQVNTFTTADQSLVSVASDASGNFVVVWNGRGQGDTDGVFGQRYDSGGVAQGAEFRVNSYTSGTQFHPSVASDASGNFLVVWYGSGQGDSSFGIFGQRYDSEGVPQGAEFLVNSYTTQRQERPSVASDASGNFVVVWESNAQDDSRTLGIFGQRYDSGGAPLGQEFRVNSYMTGSQRRASVASDPGGNFVVVWQGPGQGDSNGIFGQRYDSAGGAQGAEFRVNSYTQGDQEYASVASDASGNFVVVWKSDDQDGSGYGIFGQRYDSAGEAQGAEFQVNSYTGYHQTAPSVASTVTGESVVTWQSRFQDETDYSVVGQRYDSGGVPRGQEFRVNSYTTGTQAGARVASTGSAQFVVAWSSCCQDGNAFGVFGQRFDLGNGMIKVESPNTNVKWRIGSLQQVKWTHNLGLGATFLIELDRNNDGNYEEQIAAATPSDDAAHGHFGWIVTGPPSATARVRVLWTDERGVSDSSDVTFQIRAVQLDRELKP
jgi:hypothetical protein